MEKQYAIAFHPSEEIIEKVKEIKLEGLTPINQQGVLF